MKKNLKSQNSSKRTVTKVYKGKYYAVRMALIRNQKTWEPQRKELRRYLRALGISPASEIIFKDKLFDNVEYPFLFAEDELRRDWTAVFLVMDDDIPVVLKFEGYRSKILIEGAYEFKYFAPSGNIIYDERSMIYYDYDQ